MSDETADPAERPTVTCQTAFCADGGLEPAQSSVETSLTDFGLDAGGQDRPTRLDRPRASTFGVDDRPFADDRTDETGAQAQLVTDAHEAQRTLDGERAAGQARFGGGTGRGDADSGSG